MQIVYLKPETGLPGPSGGKGGLLILLNWPRKLRGYTIERSPLDNGGASRKGRKKEFPLDIEPGKEKKVQR